MGIKFGRQTEFGHLSVPAESKEPYPAAVEATLREEAAQIIARYPQARSALQSAAIRARQSLPGRDA